MSRLLHGVAGDEVTPTPTLTLTPTPPSTSSSALQNENPSENVNPKIDNTKMLERIAAQSQKEDKAQISAGSKAYSNQEYDEAIVHYKKAMAINPSDGSIYNNIGNVYLRGKNDPKTALPYYIQATTIEPSFNYGWMNLALCQKQLGDIASAKTTISMALKELNSEDGLYAVLTQLQSQLE